MSKSCESARFVHHPPQVQLDIFSIFFREINEGRLLHEECALVVVCFQDASFVVGEGVDTDLWKKDRVSICPVFETRDKKDGFVPGRYGIDRAYQGACPAS